MRFAPTAEQADMRQVVADLLTETCPPSVVRSGDAGGVFAALAELGATGLLVPEDAGGLGLDENFLVPIMIEVGRAAAPLPIGDTVAVAPVALAGTGRLDDLVAGEVTVAADPQRTGRIHFAAAATVAVIGGFDGAGPVTVVDLAGADRTRLAAIDPAADLAAVAGGREIGRIDDPDAVRLIWRRGVLAAAAELIGLSRRMLDLTVGYVSERRQFGAPIGSFQAVKHHLASALIAVEFAAPAVAAAGALMAAGAGETEIERQLATAKALASDAAGQVARATLQCHGAIAYTTEYDWQLYAKRAWALAAAWGSAAHHRAAAARSLGLRPAGTS